MSASSGAAKRLRKELLMIERAAMKSAVAKSKGRTAPTPDDDDGVYLRPSSQESILKWTALIKGPLDTPYEGGVFHLDIKCGNDYPLAPPTITFVTKIFHPNVHFKTGEVCLDILKKEWSPAWGLQAACRAVTALLSDPDADSPLNCDAGNMIRHGDMLAYKTTARMYTKEAATFIPWPNTSSTNNTTNT